MNVPYIKRFPGTKLLLALGLFSSGIFTGCEKLVDIDEPVSYTTDERAYATDASAISVINGIYASMSAARLTAGSSITAFMPFYAGLAADEFTLFSGVNNQSYTAYYTNALLNNTSPNPWAVCYPFIYRTNVAIEGLQRSATLNDNVRKELIGEARFLRALHYFYLVNLYGPVPLSLSGDYTQTRLLSRSSVDVVYEQIIADLTEAEALLSSDYVGSDAISTTTERTVPNKWAAKALLARAYLYNKNYTAAISTATEVINHSSLFTLLPLDEVFLANSQEAIWQLQPVNLGWNTEEGRLFIITSTGPTSNKPVYLSSDLLASFENGDERKTNWTNTINAGGIDYIYSAKYRSGTLNAPVTEYQMVFRLAEQYLIRAEASAQNNDLEAATADLNVIRSRSGLPDYAGPGDKSSLLEAILHERRTEFFTEMGHRWLDLKRMGKVDEVMSIATQQKGGTWSTNDQFFPISASELDRAPNINQNAGY